MKSNSGLHTLAQMHTFKKKKRKGGEWWTIIERAIGVTETEATAIR